MITVFLEQPLDSPRSANQHGLVRSCDNVKWGVDKGSGIAKDSRVCTAGLDKFFFQFFKVKLSRCAKSKYIMSYVLCLLTEMQKRKNVQTMFV